MLPGFTMAVVTVPALTCPKNAEREAKVTELACELARASFLRRNKRRPIKGSSRIFCEVNILEKVVLIACRISLMFFISLTSTMYDRYINF